ncbi:hypothetical protein ACH4S8_44015 [Streptomyces sp. NPDC021080]|uniref:hypothetical protein n=1 Tax=Streptomyces sp. NPDC021080 TaxID=3365110 RepID=UPI0037B001DA
MDLQGIGAVAAAAAAVVTIPISMLMGRRQMQNAVETVQEQGAVVHSQWRREVRREAYIAFLSKTTRVIELADEVTKPAADGRVERAAIRDQIAMGVAEVRSERFSIELEGPDTVFSAAERLMVASGRIAQRTTLQIDCLDALRYFEDSAGSDPSHEAVQVVRAAGRLVGRAESIERQLDQESTSHAEATAHFSETLMEFLEASNALPGSEAAQRRMHVSAYAASITVPLSARKAWRDAHREFMRAVRAALD